MLFTITPDPPHVGQTGALRIELDHEQAGPYAFRIASSAASVAEFFKSDGTPVGSTERLETRLRRSTDFEPAIRFTSPGKVVVEFVRGTGTGTNVQYDWQNSTRQEVAEVPTGKDVDYTVALAPSPAPASEDETLWEFISATSRRLRFDEFCDAIQPFLPNDNKSWYGSDAYSQLKTLADAFVGRAASPLDSADSELPTPVIEEALQRSYVSSVHPPSQAFLSYRYGRDYQDDLTKMLVRANAAFRAPRPPTLDFPLPNVPFVELIWNYWTEEGMLVQTLNHIVARFQNRRPGRGADPLARFDLNPLMPLRTLIWNFAEDEQSRLTVRRRAAEYEYEYGLQLRGRAVPGQSIIVDRRSQFLESFHRLLNACIGYYKERDDKTVEADAFPLLSNLRELHLVLARGAHNQFANLAVTARAEMLTMQWLLAQPEMHEFLGGPTMVPYEEPWMDRVDTMKSIHGWSDTSITHFFDLAVQGEQVLLSVRHGRWNESTRKREDAANWALLWRNEIQRYIHAYSAVTGVDLNVRVDATMPSALIARRITEQRRRA